MIEYPNGLTVSELKQLIQNWSETDADGEPCEVWVTSGQGISAPVTRVWPLNSRISEDGSEHSDILFDY